MAERHRSNDGRSETEELLKGMPDTPSFQGRQGGDLERDIATEDEIKQVVGDGGRTRVTKSKARENGPAEAGHGQSEADSERRSTPLTTGAWVVVCDGDKALILENEGDKMDLNLRTRRKEEQDNPKDIEQSANRPGHIGESAQPGGHTYDDTDWHQLARERFAADLSDLLYDKAHDNAFDQIVLVAAPDILGELRTGLHKAVAEKVVAEVPKTLTNHPLDEIERVLVAELKAA